MRKKTEYTRQIGQKNVFSAPVGGYSDHYGSIKNLEEPPKDAKLVWSDKENRMVWQIESEVNQDVQHGDNQRSQPELALRRWR